MPNFDERDRVRSSFMAGLIAGRGIEIGAGPFPQALPQQAQASHYDIRPERSAAALFQAPVVNARPMAAIAGDFPDGADFLIAHNVLEHAPDPIGTLRNWNAYVRDGGIVLLSLPHLWFCADANRQIPGLDHLIQDHLASADGDDFSSREHAAAFILGWSKEFAAAENVQDIPAFSQRALDSIRTAKHDLHWHALDTELSLKIVAAAAMFAGVTIEVLKVASPEMRQTVGDILIAYKIVRRGPVSDAVGRLVTAASDVRSALDAVAAVIEAGLPSRPAGPRAMLLRRPFSSEGLCATAPIPPELLAADATLTIEEDGLPLGPAESLHDEIRQLGGGRFSIWGDRVYFSASDGSDCNRNGRNYLISAGGRG
jgi:hypothetical protein